MQALGTGEISQVYVARSIGSLGSFMGHHGRWQTSDGKKARVFHSTMGSAHDLQSAGLRRLIINAADWGMGMGSAITPTRSVDIVGTYQPLESGFNDKQLGVVPNPVSAYKQ